MNNEENKQNTTETLSVSAESTTAALVQITRMAIAHIENISRSINNLIILIIIINHYNSNNKKASEKLKNYLE